METISQLKLQKRNKNRLNVYFDGEFAFSIFVALAGSLKVGQHMTSDEIDRLMQLDSYERAKGSAFRILSYRPRSTAEVRNYLAGKGFEPIVIEQTIDRLGELEYLDDAAFARYWVDQREKHNPRGSFAIRHELYQKGISDEVIDDAVAGIDDEELAIRIAEKKAASWSNLSREQFVRKLGGYLKRRGFDYPVVIEVTNKVWRSREDHL